MRVFCSDYDFLTKSSCGIGTDIFGAQRTTVYQNERAVERPCALHPHWKVLAQTCGLRRAGVEMCPA